MASAAVQSGPGCTAQVQYRDTMTEVQMHVLPRRVLKWLQSLKLSSTVGRNPRREVSNGYAVVEILSRHAFKEREEDLRVFSFENDFSLDRKLANWDRIRATLARKGMKLPEGLIDATIHAKNGAAEYMLQLLYSMLTGVNMLVTLPDDHIYDDTDYQATLAEHARPTVSSAINANVRPAEAKTDPDELSQTRNVRAMMTSHRARIAEARDLDPTRYGRVTLDATGHPQRLQTVPASPGRDSAKMLRSTKFTTQRLLNAAALSPIKVTSSPATTLAPLKVTKRLEAEVEAN